MGPVGSNSEGEFGKDPQKRIDFAYRGNHATALVAKALIKAYYGKPARYAYFSGCSDAGREALVEVERYPGDFDGVAAGAPAMHCLTAAEVETARKLYAGPTDAAGHHFTAGGPQPGSELSWKGVYVPDTADGHVMSEGAAAAS